MAIFPTGAGGQIRDSLRNLRQEINPQSQGVASILGQIGQPATQSMVAPVVTPEQQKTQYDQRTAEYNRLRSDYDQQLRGLDYSHQAYNRTGGLWNQLEQQRQSGGGYGNNRFYMNGEIYNYNPEMGTYQGAISRQVLAAPQEYQAPQLTMTDPGTYEAYMSEDPYYQSQQTSTTPAATTEPTRPAAPGPTSPTGGARYYWTWNGDRWIRKMDYQFGHN